MEHSLRLICRWDPADQAGLRDFDAPDDVGGDGLEEGADGKLSLARDLPVSSALYEGLILIDHPTSDDHPADPLVEVT